MSQALATAKVRVLSSPQDAISRRFEVAAFAVMAPVAAQNADGMRRLAGALHEAQVYTNSHLPKTVEVVSAYSGIRPKTVARSLRMIDPEYVELRNIQPVIDLLAQYGAIDNGFPATEIISPYALKPAH